MPIKMKIDFVSDVACPWCAVGLGALEGLLRGEKNVMAGVVNNQLVYTPFHDTITKKKPVSEDLIRMVEILST